ncbi:unnamed protein product [Anisakis simplex]|uniref:Putative serine/threonine-protein kinase (inferred by orthology to a C. elegans protein) n=1 Tax=Anisakis simplex TaxID=6269 RepID=A0A0M3KHY1_ANISI|nr:unnamed protein product [Anisakis simplex]
MAPEIARGDPYNKAVDWWSFGVLLHILLTNRYPFPNRGIMSHEELSFNDYSTPNCEPALGDLLNQNIFKYFLLLYAKSLTRKCHVLLYFIMNVGKNFAIQNRSQFQLEPFANIEKLRRCPSCNLMYDRSGSELSGTDGEENWAAFDEHYEVRIAFYIPSSGNNHYIEITTDLCYRIEF